VVFPLAAVGQEETGQAGVDPDAVDLIKRSAGFLAGQPAMSFNWFVSYDVIVKDKEKLTFMRSGSNVLVRDKGLYSREEGESGTRQYFHDGKRFVVSAPDENYYADQEFEGGFEALVERVREATGTDIPIHSIMSRDLPDQVGDQLTGAAYLGRTTITGREVHHVAFSDEVEDWQVWISTDEDEPVPLVIVGTNPRETGWPQYRAYLTDWNFKPDITDATFTFKPDDDDVRVTLPDLKARNEAAQAQGQDRPSPAADREGKDEAAAAPGPGEAAGGAKADDGAGKN
jgi:hypothetical protein